MFFNFIFPRLQSFYWLKRCISLLTSYLAYPKVMENSQSSDFLSESADIICHSPADPTTMDALTYDLLLSSILEAIPRAQNNIKQKTLPALFSTLLEDCAACISQSFDLIQPLLDKDAPATNIVVYINNAVCILKSLANFTKKIVESVSMTCCSMNTFPTIMGHIISMVFIHCKDSESFYGSHLDSIQQQLKDLFKTCHELQLTYLMVLDKHFIFDITKEEEQDVLIKALDINLKIGDIVQSLDVKTMAEQWKAYCLICEKYSDSLMDKNIYDDCTKILCAMITKNVQIALESNQDEKIMLRSLKVSNFCLKILLKLYNIFKNAINKNQAYTIDMLLIIYINNGAYLKTIALKTPQFIDLYNINITVPSNNVLNELTFDENFMNCLCAINGNELRNDEKLLGLILIVLDMIKVLLKQRDDQPNKLHKNKIINCIYNFLPYCHAWFNIDLEFKMSSQYTCGLYEYLLIHTNALVLTMTNDEFNALEKRMVEAILSTECYSALFSSNLWMLLSSYLSSRNLLLSQVVSLCKIYQKLENNNLFVDSPQQIHLAYTLGELFKIMSNEDRVTLHSMFKIHEDQNVMLWSVLKIHMLPIEVEGYSEKIVIDKFKMQLRKILSQEYVDVDQMIKLMYLASTCKFIDVDVEMETFVMKAWAKACPTNNRRLTRVLNKGTMWYLKYVKGLVGITNAMERSLLRNSSNLIKVLHVIFGMIQSGSTELKLLLINFIIKLANCIKHDQNQHLAESILTETFAELFQDVNTPVRNKLFFELRKHSNDNLDKIIHTIISGDLYLTETWRNFIEHGNFNKNPDMDVKQTLLAAMDYSYCHKCIVNSHELTQTDTRLRKSTNSNFDFGDIDTLFDKGNDTEPANKKAKLIENVVEKINDVEPNTIKNVKSNSDDVVDEIISRLEVDSASLCKIKENFMNAEYQKRIKKICNKLANILE